MECQEIQKAFQIENESNFYLIQIYIIWLEEYEMIFMKIYK